MKILKRVDYLSTVSGLLALALANQGRYDEADRYAEEGREIGAEDDLITQVYWRLAKAHVLAARGARDEAARLSGEAIELTNSLPHAFDSPIAAAEVAGYLEPDAARLALEQALASATAKGNVLSTEQIRAKLAALP